MLRSALLLLGVLAATPTFAQSSLGITGATLRAGADDTTSNQEFAELSFDVAITEYHGFQGAVSLADSLSGAEGRLDAHLYMTPRDGQKYGFFGFLSDFDGRSATYGGFGAEGLFALGDATALEVRGGLGLADQDSLDFVFAEAGIYHDFSESVTFGLSTTITEFDEANLSAIGHEVSLSIEVHPQGQPLGFFADISRDGLSGDDNRPGETIVRAGVSIEFGNSRRGGPETRLFSSPDPLRTLIRRDLF